MQFSKCLPEAKNASFMEIKTTGLKDMHPPNENPQPPSPEYTQPPPEDHYQFESSLGIKVTVKHHTGGPSLDETLFHHFTKNL